MKKLAFVVVLVAAIVGMVFGGISGASAGHLLPPDNTSHPTCSPRPTPTPDCCQDVNSKVTSIQNDVSTMQADLGNEIRMETGSGNVSFDQIDPYSEVNVFPERQNPQVRHVHLTYAFTHSTFGETRVALTANIMNGLANYYDSHSDNSYFGYYTEDFDAQSWQLQIIAGNLPEDNASVVYAWTETYSP